MPGIRVSLYFDCDYAKIVKNVSARDIQTNVVVLRDSKETICIMAEGGTGNRPIGISSIVEIPIEPVASYKHATIVDDWLVSALCYGNIAGWWSGKDGVYRTEAANYQHSKNYRRKRNSQNNRPSVPSRDRQSAQDRRVVWLARG